MGTIERAARTKQAAIIAREGDPDGIIASDAYLAELIAEQRRQALCVAIYCGHEIYRGAGRKRAGRACKWKGGGYMSIIYEPKGAAKEYCDLALNIYNGCTNGCYYCYAPKVLHRQKEDFHHAAILRPVVTPEQVKKEIGSHHLEGRTIQLCFTCDPYPSGTDTAPTREIIDAIKIAGANVQILTKNGSDAIRDFDLLTPTDSFGVTITTADEEKSKRWEPNAELPSGRIGSLFIAKGREIKTWVSFEPVVDGEETLTALRLIIRNKLADVVKIGKMNYFDTAAPIDWAFFGRCAEQMCKESGQPYCIKAGLRAEMEAVH